MALGLGVAKGMLTTISHLVRRPITIQYPEERLEMPIWTRGRPRLIYEVDTGELRCTACGACALACPVDVIKIEQHPSPTGKGKILDRFDIDMAGCIECALCVEACPFRAITMAPDFEMAAYEREHELVYDMYDLRIPGTPEVDLGMEHIQGVKRGLGRQAGAARPAPAAGARPAAPAAAGAAPAAAAPARPAPATTAPAAAAPKAEAAAAPAPAAKRDRPPAPSLDFDPLTVADEQMKELSPAQRAQVYKARRLAATGQAGGPATGAAPAAPTGGAAVGQAGPVAGQAAGASAAPSSDDASGTQVATPSATPEAAVASGQGRDQAAAGAAKAAAAPTSQAAPTDYDPLTISDEDLKKLPPAERAKVYKARRAASGPPA
jgi:NADH-quinone oxidoreductase chain I